MELEFLERCCDEIIQLFDELIPYQYTEEDRKAADAFVEERISRARSCLDDLQRLCAHGHFRLDGQLGAVREMVMGTRPEQVMRHATPEEIGRMKDLVAQAMEDGAFGLSTGLEYTPGAFATREELIAVCRPLAERGLPYASHMRNEDDYLMEAVNEAIAATSQGGSSPIVRMSAISW